MIRALHSANSPPCDVRLCNLQHVEGGLVQLDKHTVVDLAQAEQLQDFARLWVYAVDTEIHAHRQLTNAQHTHRPVNSTEAFTHITVLLIHTHPTVANINPFAASAI